MVAQLHSRTLESSRPRQKPEPKVISLRYRGVTVELDELRHRVRINEHEVRLTGSQMRVCLFLARARGRVHSRGQILAAAQAGRCFIRRVDERQADSLLSDVRAKFRAVHADAAGLIKAVYGEGYKAVTE